jgi:two-component system, OmpR family, sensor histidine kinase KdpD
VTTLLESEGGHRTIELDSEGRGEFLSIIDEETDRLDRFINGMVELARVEAGQSSGIGSLASVEEIISISLERAETSLAERPVKVNLANDLPLIRVDARAIAEVVYNLVENAVKYSPPRSPVRIDASSNGDRVVISVSDEGKGIPLEMREQVFEKFVRLDDASHGLGLGLAIARGIVESQNGTIEVREGDGGKGTKIVVSLPIGDA